MKVLGAATLIQAARQIACEDLFIEKIESCEEHGLYPENSICIEGIWFPPVTEESDFKFARGESRLVRGLQIAAAGGHNLMAYGPPGCGKTLSLSKFSSLLPYLTSQQSQAVTRIHSVAGLLPPSGAIIKPQVRLPHQTASVEGMCGGGPKCMPGEISLAHKGVLFLDEAAEFRSSVLQMLRVPMETGSITLSRAGRTSVFPADFQLLMSANPCPCGNYGSAEKICLCSAQLTFTGGNFQARSLTGWISGFGWIQFHRKTMTWQGIVKKLQVPAIFACRLQKPGPCRKNGRTSSMQSLRLQRGMTFAP